MNPQQASKALKILGVLFLVHAILVSTHEGEFWPFSIYTMFSQAGNPWERAMVLDVTDLEVSVLWDEHVNQHLFVCIVDLLVVMCDVFTVFIFLYLIHNA